MNAKPSSPRPFTTLALLALGGVSLPSCGVQEDAGAGGRSDRASAPEVAAVAIARPLVSEGGVRVAMREMESRETTTAPPRRIFGHMPVPRTRGAGTLAPVTEGVLALGPAPRTPPTLGASFAALPDDDTAVPPDTMGAVGRTHVLTTLNSQVRVQDRSGNALSTVPLTGFWAAAGATGPYDPRAMYDPYGDRWIVAAADSSDPATAGLLIGASDGPDPTGTWTLHRIDADPAKQVWLDFPSLGFNKTWVVVTGNMYDSGDNFVRESLFIFDKSSLYSGAATLSYSVIDDSTIQDTLSPAETYDPALSTMYLLQMWNGNQGGVGALRLYTITGPVGAEALSPVAFIQGPAWGSLPDPTGADFAPQLGSAVKIQNNDDRLGNTVYRNGKLYTSHNVFLPASGPTRTAVQWWQVDPSGTLLQRGRIEDTSSTGRFYAFPSIAVNKNDDVLVGMSRFSATQFASANYAFRQVSDPAGTMQPDVVVKAGQGVYDKVAGQPPQNRWGDYSHTVVDPVDDLALWTIQEYAAQRVGGVAHWGTWWAQLIPPPPTCGADGAPCDDGNACTKGDTCQGGVCVGGASVVCTALDACHGVGTCDAATGACSSPALPDGSACNDGNACTTGDVCKGGVCGGAAVVCPVPDQCHTAGTCDPSTGACGNPAKPDGSACNDGNACTTGDVCKGGVCGGAAVACPAPDQCHTAGTCDPSTGACGNPAKPDGSACNDGNACTTGDVCKGGVCGGTAVACPAPDQCHTAGTCNPATGACTSPAPKPDGSPCDDGNACTQSDVCLDGQCQGATVDCAPTDCTVPAGCDPSTGQCIMTPVPDGTPCAFGFCTAGACTSSTSSSSTSSSSTSSGSTSSSTSSSSTSSSGASSSGSSSSGGGAGGATTGSTTETDTANRDLRLYGRACTCDVPRGEGGGSRAGLASLAALALAFGRRRRR